MTWVQMPSRPGNVNEESRGSGRPQWKLGDSHCHRGVRSNSASKDLWSFKRGWELDLQWNLTSYKVITELNRYKATGAKKVVHNVTNLGPIFLPHHYWSINVGYR